jgi:hypothetical protein
MRSTGLGSNAKADPRNRPSHEQDFAFTNGFALLNGVNYTEQASEIIVGTSSEE